MVDTDASYLSPGGLRVAKRWRAKSDRVRSDGSRSRRDARLAPPEAGSSEEPVLATAEERAFARYARDQVPLIFDNPIQRLFIADVSVEELRELDYGQCDVPFYDLREDHDYEAVVRVVWVYWTDTDRIRVNCDDFERVRLP